MPDRKNNKVNTRPQFKENEYCICVHCGNRIPHKRGVPCRENRCPECGKIMFKEGSYHHQLFIKKSDQGKKQ